MHKRTAGFVVFAVITQLSAWAPLGGCEENEPAPARRLSREDPLRIVTTIRPLELILRGLVPEAGGEVIVIHSLLAPDTSPHGFEPTASQVAQLHSADLVVHVGLGLDDWAGRNLPPRVRVVHLSDLVDGAGEPDDAHAHDHDHEHDGHAHEDHDHDHDHAHGPVDEHLWLDPPAVAATAARCAAELRQLLAEGAATATLRSGVEDALVEFSASVQSVDHEFADRLAPYAGRPIVTDHNVFSRPAARYGLGDPIVLRPLAMVEPTAADLRRAIDAVREYGIAAVLVEPQFSALAAERLREETGVKLIRVDPLGREARDWPTMMRDILGSMLECFGLSDADAEATP